MYIINRNIKAGVISRSSKTDLSVVTKVKLNAEVEDQTAFSGRVRMYNEAVVLFNHNKPQKAQDLLEKISKMYSPRGLADDNLKYLTQLTLAVVYLEVGRDIEISAAENIDLRRSDNLENIISAQIDNNALINSACNILLDLGRVMNSEEKELSPAEREFHYGIVNCFNNGSIKFFKNQDYSLETMLRDINTQGLTQVEKDACFYDIPLVRNYCFLIAVMDMYVNHKPTEYIEKIYRYKKLGYADLLKPLKLTDENNYDNLLLADFVREYKEKLEAFLMAYPAIPGNSRGWTWILSKLS